MLSLRNRDNDAKLKKQKQMSSLILKSRGRYAFKMHNKTTKFFVSA
jgi:hypothetical protein